MTGYAIKNKLYLNATIPRKKNDQKGNFNSLK